MLKNIAAAHETYTKATNWPPYNIVKIDENNYTIELAVAGFGKHNLDIELANNTLVVKGGFTDEEIDPVDNPVQYLWKGVADRVFTRKFTLADTVEVKNAEYINGMLKIFLENVVPEEKKPRKVDIK
jgi:molecular chaperone IbpA